MFTGIIEEVGIIHSIEWGEIGKVVIGAKVILDGTKVGDSISSNGVCLTVIEVGRDRFTATIMKETAKKSTWSRAKSGDRVNLERALTIEKRLGGHIVSGHVDCTGILKTKKTDPATPKAFWYEISIDAPHMRFIANEGSVALDGVSLTVARVDDKRRTFWVSTIPHSRDKTTLGDKSVGDLFNIECDVIIKYLARLSEIAPQG